MYRARTIVPQGYLEDLELKSEYYTKTRYLAYEHKFIEASLIPEYIDFDKSESVYMATQRNDLISRELLTERLALTIPTISSVPEFGRFIRVKRSIKETADEYMWKKKFQSRWDRFRNKQVSPVPSHRWIYLENGLQPFERFYFGLTNIDSGFQIDSADTDSMTFCLKQYNIQTHTIINQIVRESLNPILQKYKLEYHLSWFNNFLAKRYWNKLIQDLEIQIDSVNEKLAMMEGNDGVQFHIHTFMDGTNPFYEDAILDQSETFRRFTRSLPRQSDQTDEAYEKAKERRMKAKYWKLQTIIKRLKKRSKRERNKAYLISHISLTVRVPEIYDFQAISTKETSAATLAVRTINVCKRCSSISHFARNSGMAVLSESLCKSAQEDNEAYQKYLTAVNQSLKTQQDQIEDPIKKEEEPENQEITVCEICKTILK